MTIPKAPIAEYISRPMKHYIRPSGGQVLNETAPGGQKTLEGSEDLSRAINRLFGPYYDPDKTTTAWFIDTVLSRDDYRRNTARMYAKDKVFGPYLVDMVETYRKFMTNGTVKDTFNFTMRRVDWNVVANHLRQS